MSIDGTIGRAAGSGGIDASLYRYAAGREMYPGLEHNMKALLHYKAALTYLAIAKGLDERLHNGSLQRDFAESAKTELEFAIEASPELQALVVKLNLTDIAKAREEIAFMIEKRSLPDRPHGNPIFNAAMPLGFRL